MMGNEREIRIYRRVFDKVKGERVFVGEETLFEGYAYFTTISTREREFFSQRVGDVEFKIFVSYYAVSNLTDDCVIEFNNRAYDIVELRDEGMMAEFWGILVKGKQ